MQRTGDQYWVKEINTGIVLDTIIRQQPISRARISEITGLNKGTVSNLVQQLIERQLVYETGTGASSGGRRPVMLQLRSNAGYAIGVDLGVNDMRIVATDLLGRIETERTETLASKAPGEVAGQLALAVQRVIGGLPRAPYGVVGIGIGVPGMVDEEGVVLLAPNLGWKNFDLAEALQPQFAEIPLFIDNEANAGAIGEKQFGAGQDVSALIYVSAAIGIGAGIVLSGELFRGAAGLSGETGHISIHAEGPVCSCGSRGCWELYASERALIDKARKFAQHAEPTLESLVALAEQGHPEAVSAFRETGHYLGIGIANLLNLFNPELVVIGNRLTMAEAWISDSLAETVRERALPHHARRASVLFSRLGTRSTAVGAAYMAVSPFIRQAAGGPL